MKRRHLVFVALLATALAGLAFACGSDDGPDACTGPLCDGGSSESGTTDGGGGSDADAGGGGGDGDAGDGDASADARVDSPDDAGACKLEAPDADAGPSGTLQWALNFGVSGYTYPTTVARDPANGDIVVTGYFWGTTDFGGGALVSQAPMDGSGSDVFLARFDKSGAYKWANAWGNGSNISANAVAVGPAGEMVFAGLLRQGSLDFGCASGPIASGGSPDMFVVKLDKSGACVWSKGIGAAGVTTVAIDGSGNAVLAGGTPGGVDFGGGGLSSGFYLAKLTSNGTHAWSKSFTATTSYGGPYAALDAQGNAILAGSFSSSIDLGGGPLYTAGAAPGNGTNAAFAAKFDAFGKHMWSHQYGEGVGGKNVSISGVATDSCNNVVLHGPFGGTVNFGTDPLVASDTTKSYAFLARLTPNGAGILSKMFVASAGGPFDAFGVAGIAVDATGGVTLAPRLMGDGLGRTSTADFGGGPITSAGRGSVAVASFDQGGRYRWAYGVSASSTASASFPAFPTPAAAWGSSVVVAGAFSKCTMVCATAPPGTTLVLAGRTLTAVSGADLFIASFTP